MNDESTTQQVLEYTDKLGEYLVNSAEKVAEFAKEQIPPLVTEYLHWKFLEASVTALFWLILIASVWGVYRYAISAANKKMIYRQGLLTEAKNFLAQVLQTYGNTECRDRDYRREAEKKVDKRQEEVEFIYISTSIVRWAGLVVFVIFSSAVFPAKEIKNCLQIKIAPKVFLIEKGYELIKGK